MKRYFILLFIVINILAYFLLENKYSSRTNEYLESKLVGMENHYALAVDTFDTYAQLIFHNAIQTEELYQIIKYLPNSSEAQKEYIRKQLYEHVLPLYKNLKENYYVRQVHFHLPDGRSFLRMHRPDKYGDFLFDIRPAVKEANVRLIDVKGFEEGRIFNSYRFVFPMIFKDEHYGSIEISVTMDAITDYMKNISQSEYCFMIKKLLVSDTVFDDEKVNYEQSILSQWYLHDKMINHDYCTKVIASVLETIKSNNSHLSKINNSSAFSAAINDNRSIYTATFLPVKNTSDIKVAYLFSVENDPVFGQFKIDFITKMLLTLISTLSLFSLIYFLFYRNKMITNKNIKLEENIEKKSDALQTLHKNEQRDILFFNIITSINKKIMCNTPIDEILKYCVNRFMILPTCTFSVISVNLEEEYLFFSDACGRFDTDKTKICDKIFQLVKNCNNYSNKEPVIINDLSKIQELAGVEEIFAEHQVRSIIIVPIVAEASWKKFGHVILFSARTECFDENERQLFQELSNSISFAISFNQTEDTTTQVKAKEKK